MDAPEITSGLDRSLESGKVAAMYSAFRYGIKTPGLNEIRGSVPHQNLALWARVAFRV